MSISLVMGTSWTPHVSRHTEVRLMPKMETSSPMQADAAKFPDHLAPYPVLEADAAQRAISLARFLERRTRITPTVFRTGPGSAKEKKG
jgi:hypothetical protein